jgi:hypothetical protein
MRADPIVAQSVVMLAVPVAVMHAVPVVALSVTAPCVRHVRLALIARRASVRMIVHSGVNRLKAAKLFASYLQLVVVARAKF